MCNAFVKQYDNDCCKYCPLDHYKSCGAIWEIEEDTHSNIAETVDAWAEEHPGPQYPTWAELMYDNFIVWRQKNHPHHANVEKAWFDFTHENPIPADIAEKLGLKPKGGENDV